MPEHIGQERLHAYLDRELAPAQRAGVERHLRACATCRQALARAETLFGRIAAVDAVPMPRSVVPQVVAEVERQIRRKRRMRWLLLAEAGLLAAVVILLGLAGVLRQGFSTLSDQTAVIQPLLEILAANLRLQAAGLGIQVSAALRQLAEAATSWQPVRLPQAPWMAIMAAALALGLVGNGLLLGRQFVSPFGRRGLREDGENG